MRDDLFLRRLRGVASSSPHQVVVCVLEGDAPLPELHCPVCGTRWRIDLSGEGTIIMRPTCHKCRDTRHQGRDFRGHRAYVVKLVDRSTLSPDNESG